MLKCKGFSLRTHEYVDFSKMSEMEVRRRLENVNMSHPIPQFNICTEKKSRQLYNAYSFKHLSSHILSKRVLVKKGRWTLPFGYTDKMLENPFVYDEQ